MSHPHATATREKPDIFEHGAPKDGVRQQSDTRLYCQLQAFTNCSDINSLIAPLEASGIASVLYSDVNDPYGAAVVVMTDDPSSFTESVRTIFQSEPFRALKHRPELTMIGRTYSLGREQDLEDWLLRKPIRTTLNPEWPWAIWYPLRRKAEFELLEKAEQGKILMTHAMIGMGYGQADFAHDVRLACHGLDQNDNEFVIGLVGKELFPLSRIVQDMRKTEQTAKYIQSLGPFFVGKVNWQSPQIS